MLQSITDEPKVLTSDFKTEVIPVNTIKPENKKLLLRNTKEVMNSTEFKQNPTKQLVFEYRLTRKNVMPEIESMSSRIKDTFLNKKANLMVTEYVVDTKTLQVKSCKVSYK
jgi:hypothetical protein